MRKILICEDEFELRKMYSTAFSMGGTCIVEEAGNGAEFLEKVKNNVYDLILLDIKLPDADGLEILRTLKQDGTQNTKTPVYLLTNVDDQKSVMQAFSLGANGYFIKANYEPAMIVSEIDNFFLKKEKL